MNYQTFPSRTKLDRTIEVEQFDEIIKAIADGKYSWACILTLRSAGYNPLDYVPYRTYNRQLKENKDDQHQNSV
jgi:hypothetical protein